VAAWNAACKAGDEFAAHERGGDTADDSKELSVAKRGSTSTSKKSPARTTTSSATRGTQADRETVADSVAIFIGKNVGKAVKGTRALRARLADVGTDVVDAGRAVKGYLPEVMGGKARKPKQKAGAAGARKRKTKTVAPKPAHGHDEMTQQASTAVTKPAKATARAAAVQRRALAPRRG
jgi:hypothetical protein